MKTDLDELEALARAATQGPWCEHPNGTSVWSGEMYDTDGHRGQRHLFNVLHLDEQAINDVMFVAAANPEAVLELICLVRSIRVGDFPRDTKLRLFMPGRTMHDLPCAMVAYVHDARYEYVVRLGRSGELWPARRSQLVLDES